MTEQMDSIDQRQQADISELQKKDIAHDRDLFWMKCVAVLSVVMVCVIAVFFFQMNERVRPYNCPHRDCIHHGGLTH